MRHLLFACFLLLSTVFASAQTVLDGVYVKEHVQTKRVVPYTPLREADVMWSKRMWRFIDVNEKINLPLRYPRSVDKIKDRRNLMEVIHTAVKEGTLTAYKDEEFTTPLTQTEAATLDVRDDTVFVDDPNNPDEKIQKTSHTEFDPDGVIKYRIKEDWFFDKQRSVMDVRIIGISPVNQIKTSDGTIVPGDHGVYWIYYPEARNLLVNNEVFNRFNDAERRSFDDIFMKRMFSSVIYKESNVYDRTISFYKENPLDQLLEAQKIKEDIFNMEHDLWEY